MTFEFHPPKYYKNLKQNSRSCTSKNNASEATDTSNYGGVKVGSVGSHVISYSAIHNSTKGTKNDR